MTLVGAALAHLNHLSLDREWDSWKLEHRKEYNGLVGPVFSFMLSESFCARVILSRMGFTEH